MRRRSGAVDAEWLFGDGEFETARGAETDLAAASRPVESAGAHGADAPGQIGRFEIVRRLGSGGYGVVFLALDPDLNREVAIKVPAPDVLLNDEFRQRFLREGEAAAVLNHPHIVTVHEAGQIGAVNYIASEYIAGTTLAEWLAQDRERIPPRVAAELIKVLADALQHAHGRGVLHRDIKPGNVMLEYGGRETLAADDLAGAARLTDFGLARVDGCGADPQASLTGDSILGTPAYMAPEQAEGRNRDVDAGTDVYALGVILYELLVGAPPFKRATRIATLRAIWCEEVVPPCRRATHIPPDLEAVCLKCLQKEQAARYITAADLAEDLARYLKGEAVTARRPTRGERFLRWCRRNPAVAGLAAVVTVLLVVIAVGSTLTAWQLSKSRDQALGYLRRETDLKNRATQSEELALRRLFDARLAEVRASRRSGVPGQRLDGLQAVADAVDVAERLELGAEATRPLRDEALACLSLVDLEPDTQWETQLDASVASANDADIERYACSLPESGDIEIRNLADNALIATLHQPESGFAVSSLLFSPGGRHLACIRLRNARSAHLQVWDLVTPSLLHESPLAGRGREVFDFSRDGTQLAVGRRNGSVDVLRLPDLSVVQSIPVPPDEIPPPGSLAISGGAPVLVRFHSDGLSLNVQRSKSGREFDLTTGQWGRRAKYPGGVSDTLWNADGSLFAVAHGNLVTIRRTTTSLRAPEVFERVLTLPARVTHISLHPGEQILSTYSEDNRTRIWDLDDGRQLLEFGGEATAFSRDGRWLGRPAGRWRVFLPEGSLRLRHPRGEGTFSAQLHLSVHPSGRLLAAGNYRHTALWDLETGTPVAEVEGSRGAVEFTSSGRHLVVVTDQGVSRLPITRTQSPQVVHYHFGPPEVLSQRLEPLTVDYCEDMAVANDGIVVAFCDSATNAGICLFNLRSGFSGFLESTREVRWLDISPDGHVLVSSTRNGGDVRIWDTGGGELLKSIGAGSARTAFSPDGARLAVDDGAGLHVLSAANWEPVLQPRLRATGIGEPGCLAFSPDGRLLATLDSQNTVLLIDAANHTEVARFELSFGTIVESLAFTPNSDRLIAASRGNWGTLHVWDLQRLRTQLAALNLDWDLPSLPDRFADTVPVRVTFD